MEFLERYEGQLRAFRDEQLMADWEQAKRRDTEDPDGIDIMRFIEGFNSGRYWEDRKKGRRREPEPTLEQIYTIGRQLAAERVRAGLRQQELAAAAGLSRDAIAKIERNARHLSFAEACRLADALRVPLDSFRS